MEEKNDQIIDEDEIIISAEDGALADEKRSHEGDKHSRHHHSGHSHHHHHHSSRSHRRHRSGRSSKKQKKSKFVAFCKRNKSVLVNILSCTISVVLLILLAVNTHFFPKWKGANGHKELTQETVKIEVSIYPQKVSLVHEAISYYMAEEHTESALEVYKSYKGYEGGLNQGMPFLFTYNVTGLPAEVEVKSIVLKLSDTENDPKALVYPLSADRGEVEIFNLKTGTKYYYRVDLTLSDGCEVGTTGSFETEATPRILNIEGAVNVRDIGGWETVDGARIRQGLLIRGSELDGAVHPDYKITDRGLQQLIGELGIRFDMDLRESYENKSGVDALGKNVIHKYYGVDMYANILKAEQKENVRRVFSDLANPDNYPVYLHCTYGRDRTGSVCYLLEALLGMSDEDLRREYELSTFTDSYVNLAEFNLLIEELNRIQGSTTMEKVENYLLSIGVTAEEIASIREIFLEK